MEIISNLSLTGDEKIAGWTKAADSKRKSRAWNDKKISAHHAIIPTTVKANVSTLSAEERNIYHLIARSYLAQFYPLHVYDQTKIEVRYKDELFTASGRTERELGWKIMYQSNKRKNDASDAESDDDGDNTLPVMKKMMS